MSDLSSYESFHKIDECFYKGKIYFLAKTLGTQL